MKKAVIVGAGIAGLAVGIRLASRPNLEVTILERNPNPGGRASFFEIDGFQFDAGPTLITEPRTLQEVWQSANRRLEDYVELIPLDPYYRVHFSQGKSLDYSGNTERMIEQIRSLAPGDENGYLKLLTWTQSLYNGVFQELARKPFLQFRDVIAAIPGLIQSRAWISAYSRASAFFDNEYIRQLFSFHSLFIGGNPRRASALYLVIPYIEKNGGVFFVRGGTANLVRALEKLFTELGGTIVYNADVAEICTSNRKAIGVKLANAEFHSADAVICNSDITTTYAEMLPSVVRRRYSDKRLQSMHYSMSCFLLYGGTRQKYPQLQVHNIVLGDYHRTLKSIFDYKRIPDELSYYLYVPTRIDPTLAPDGCETFYALAPMPHLTDKIDWNHEKNVVKEKLVHQLEQLGMTGLSDNLQVARIITPVDFQTRFRAYRGNAFAFEPRLFQSAYWRPHNKSEEVEALYFVGAGTHPGAGVPGVLMGAEITTDLVTHQLNR